MITTNKQVVLSSFIKGLHRKLREEAKLLGTEESWARHCNDNTNLEQYAAAMRQLAENHWDIHSKYDKKVVSRLKWVHEAFKDYRMNISHYREKELKVFRTLANSADQPTVALQINDYQEKFTLLDVGSCYNPFKQFNIFNVVPIDIAPASADVYKCDFLNVNIGDVNVFENQRVIQLGRTHFDLVVFSFLLEYLPCPKQRLKCCLNAYKLLKVDGVLAIITPDSNHVGSNAKVYKSWRYVLAQYGYIRIKYEKLPYMHCMLFRKTQFKQVAEQWARIHASEQLFNEILIPQDFQKYNKTLESSSTHNGKENWSFDTFLNCIGNILE